jgi:N-carbamoylputrescine amidase
VGNGIANGLFMVVPNRWGQEGSLNFYGSSFISDPYGRILVQAPRNESAVLVADLDLDQRKDWLTLFPFLTTRRPDTYARLTEPVRTEEPFGTEPLVELGATTAGFPSRASEVRERLGSETEVSAGAATGVHA